MRATFRAAGILIVCALAALACVAVAHRESVGALRADELRCEYLVDPLGLDVREPRLSWVVEPADPHARSLVQSAYRILVADDPDRLRNDEGNLWDSGRVESSRTSQVEYAGKSLGSRQRAWWKVCVWDGDGGLSPWSESASWSMGLLEQGDWQAKWIGDPTPPPPVERANNGYHSELSKDAGAERWVEIVLGERQLVDGVRLHPAKPYDWQGERAGFLFPLRYRIEAGVRYADVETVEAVGDFTSEDVDNPGESSVEIHFEPRQSDYVRLEVTTSRQRSEGEYGVALAEMELLRGEKVISRGAKVTASSSIETSDWSTAKLVDGDLVSHGARGYEALPSPTLHKEFTLASPATRATLFVSALGLYEIHINGQRVGEHVLAPEWTDYKKRVQYQAYDVTGMIGPGANAIGALLGDGWYAGSIGLTGVVPGGPPRAIYGRRPRLLAQLEIEHADGRIEIVASDATWKSTLLGPIVVGDLLDGETYDARRELAHWDVAGLDETGWDTAEVDEPLSPKLVAQKNEPIRITRELKPIAIHSPKAGVYVFDLGQNMVGWCRLNVRGPAGKEVRLRHAEMLDEHGDVYTDNLRGAEATDRFVLRGAEHETFEPHFTYHGFRYVEVTGLTLAPALEDLTGCVFHSSAPEVGAFACSDPMLERLMQNILWTQRANLMSIPTDCPQRDERLGWMGDILAFAQTACFGMDMAAFFTKWIPDVRDAQADDGRYPDVAPHPFDPNARFSGAPAWGDAGVFVPWTAYVNYGDVRLLDLHFESARRWIEFIRAKNPDLLWKNARGNDYGDWLNADTLALEGWPHDGAEMPKEVFATAFFARSTQILAWMAKATGRTGDAEHYSRLAADIRAAFMAAYVAPDAEIQGDTQAGYAIALAFDLLPANMRLAAAMRMVEKFEHYDNLISTGFHSTICLMNELTRNGYDKEAYRLLTNREMPSWGYAVDHGATTIWERWDGWVEGRGFQDPGMNSFSHYAIGSVGEWIWRTVVGINPDPEHPGYEHFVLAPRPGGAIEWVRGSYDSIRGRITCDWKRDGERLLLHVVVPANTSATLHVPTSDPRSVTIDGVPAASADGVRVLGNVSTDATFLLGSGEYEFAASASAR